MFKTTLLALAGLQTVATHVLSFPESSHDIARQINYTSEWPYGPFNTRGRDIVNSRGEAVTWTGVNWPGSGETMVPEGVEWQSVENILDQIKSVGFNFIRLTYAVEMVDQIFEGNGKDVGLEVAMILGLGVENG